ncbi:DUF2878 domain-containing protein [Uliginosibacterium sp. H3]|uniref:DUF2878 domain-containing protein n=1 Tax=Uliginosibacterium silvisoli TaxID=3114758 RepID=A0ABU6K8X2_9RHOO|nr:DUF2878 domain-containing protein [Uliginosibacterium sp. H3]
MSEPVLAPVLFDLRPSPRSARGPTSSRVLGNFVLFQCAWFACVIGAAHDFAWLGILAISVACAWHLVISVRPMPEMRLVLSAMLIGAVWESALVTAGLIDYTHGTLVAGIAPPWIVAMWALLAITLNVTMRWLKRRWLLAAVMGAVAGPLSFLAGARLGAATFTGGVDTTVALAIGWACLMPLMMWLSDRYDGVMPTQQNQDGPHA